MITSIRDELKLIEKRLDELDPIEDHFEHLLLISEALTLDRIIHVQDEVSIDIMNHLVEKGYITEEERKSARITWDTLFQPKIDEVKERREMK